MAGKSNPFLTTSRVTGLLYLGVALTGFIAFLFVRSNLFVDGNAVKTASNLVEKETLARVGIAAELALVMFQALVAIWFYKLFKKVNSFAGGMLTVFGVINAVLILVATALWLSALSAAINGASPAITYNLFNSHENIWLVSNLFFGLWLIPMGYLVLKSKMPIALAWVLMIGGAGYVLSAFVAVLLPGQTALTSMLPMLATVGEFWIIGYLLFKPFPEK